MEQTNYYILLELPIDPPASDPGEIKAAIRKKKQEWTRWQDHPGKRTLALAYLGMLPDIEHAMLDPAARKEQARQARDLRAEMLRRMEAELRILEGKGYILPREVTALAAKYKSYGIDQQQVRALLKVAVAEQPPVPKAAEPTGEVLDRLTAKGIARNLEILEKPDLYAFLGEPPYSSIKKLQAAAEAQRRTAASAASKTAESVAAQELAGQCLRLFENFDTKQKYDRYLKIATYPAVGEQVDEEFTREKFISPGALLRLVNFAVETAGCKVLEAEEYIRRYCDAYHIPVGAEKPLILCPACKAQAERDSVVCPSCAQPLRGNCPVCATPFEEGQAACAACGFLIADMVKALPYLDGAQGAVIDGNWSTAKRNLEYVEKYWPDHPELEPLCTRVRELEERYGTIMEQIMSAVGKGQYYAALELIEEAAQKRIKLPGATVRQVQNVIEDLEAQVAALSGQEKPDLDRLLELAASVTDSIELTRLLSRQPPLPPAVLGASVSGRQVSLSWSEADAPGRVSYVLVRKQESPPFTPFDGEVLYDGPGCSYTDTTAKALTRYHYRVFTRRGGAYSQQGAVCGPVLIVPEIEDLKILPADQGAQLSWTFNPDIREVIIWRKLGGERPTGPEDGILLETTRTDAFMDTKIKNDVEYWYYLQAVYVLDGQRVVSSGVCEVITPHKILAPVDRLSIAKSDYGEGEFVVHWENPDLADLILFCSPREPDFRPGEIFPVEELILGYRSLALHARTATSGRFRYTFTGGIYLFMAVVFGKFAAVGRPHYLTNLRDVENPQAELAGDNLHLTMKWPAGLSEIAVVWKMGEYPKTMDEIGVSAQHVSREQYQYDAGVIIRDMKQGMFYFKIFALYQNPDGTRSVSEGVELTFQNIPRQEVFYRFAYKRKAFKAQAELTLTLSGPQPFTFPLAVITSLAGRLPLSRADGTPLFELDEEIRVDGEVMLQYLLDPLPQGTHLRLFLQEDSRYERFRLLPASGLKIT